MKQIITRRSLLAASAGALMAAPVVASAAPSSLPASDVKALKRALQINHEHMQRVLSFVEPLTMWTHSQLTLMKVLIKQRAHLQKRLLA